MKRAIPLFMLFLIVILPVTAVAGAIIDYYIGKVSEEPVFKTVYTERFIGEEETCPPGGATLYPYLKVGGSTVELPLANRTYYVRDGAVYDQAGNLVLGGLGQEDEIIVQGGHAYRCTRSYNGYLVWYREFKATRLDWDFTVSIEPNLTEFRLRQGESKTIKVTITNNNEVPGWVKLNVRTNSGVFNYPNDCPPSPNTCTIRPWGTNGPSVVVHANTTYAGPGETVEYVITVAVPAGAKPGSYDLTLQFYFTPDIPGLSAEVPVARLGVSIGGGGLGDYVKPALWGLGTVAFILVILRLVG
ncbi:MAG: hypothetical protein GSR84_04495 [Desulfurococcales archaeon]|nr:hypothetical protein [Desulfurococcales archaeon]